MSWKGICPSQNEWNTFHNYSYAFQIYFVIVTNTFWSYLLHIIVFLQLLVLRGLQSSHRSTQLMFVSYTYRITWWNTINCTLSLFYLCFALCLLWLLSFYKNITAIHHIGIDAGLPVCSSFLRNVHILNSWISRWLWWCLCWIDLTIFQKCYSSTFYCWGPSYLPFF